ncbi:ACP phosphodiesterase [Rheinheimera sp. 4Y26]|uniref:acyl carrier protein phosphodiesterase n=1 Tax=Rheinheimera sp. 4Y26 TaxID=2977811 RepID=UPI0021B14510|nr:ACP phosphodiesterase [Rheinheimera sp. 4Y26]MCT6699242.1 ACP phosphodiesterase [Rheinheimera sp. 4Y26]
MNYLAHLYFADNNTESRIGNLLGDFCRGVDLTALSPATKAGLMQHRAIDRFTDAAPEVHAAKLLFAAKRRRFAGVALDVLFDHYLIKHWPVFHPEPFLLYKSRLYQQLWQDRALMPERMATTISYLVPQDWFGSYASLEGIGQALDRIAGRLRFANEFSGVISDFTAYQPQFEQLFLQFFPKLQAFVRQYQAAQPACAGN